MSTPAPIMPLVSVITIVYNGEKYLEDAILSVMRQTYRPIEYIVIDGGSTDGTLSIIKKYDAFISTWISERDNGISDAFNKGLARASGEITGILNADDWYEQDAVEKAVKAICGQPGEAGADIAYGDLRLWKEGVTDFILEGDHAFLEKEMTVNHPTVFVRKEWYERFGVFDTSFRCAMDYDLLLRFSVNHARFLHIPAVLANMRWEGFSDARWLLGCKETLAIKNKYLPAQRSRNRLYFYKHVLAIALPKFLKKSGLGSLVRLYRSRLSRVKKVYE